MKRMVTESSQTKQLTLEINGVIYAVGLGRGGYTLISYLKNTDGKVYVYNRDDYIYVDYGDEFIANFSTFDAAMELANLLVDETYLHEEDLEVWLKSAAESCDAVTTY